MTLSISWLLRYLIVGVPCTRSLAPVDWHSLATAGEALPQEGLPWRGGAKLAHLQETNLTASTTSHRNNSEHEHRSTSKARTHKLAVEYAWSVDSVAPRQLHLMSIHSHAKQQHGDQAKQKDNNNWQDYPARAFVSMLLIGFTPLFLGLCLLLVFRLRSQSAEEGSPKPAAQNFLPQGSPKPAAQNFLPPIGKSPHVPSSSIHLPGFGSRRSPGHGVRAPPGSGETDIQVPSQVPTATLLPNQVSQVFTLEGSILPEAQAQTAILIKNPAGEVVAKAVMDEGRPGEIELDGLHGIVLEIPPKNHAAFLDTSEVHNKQNPLVTVIPWEDPPDPSAEPLAIVQTTPHGFAIHQSGKITLVAPINQRNGTITGLFEYTQRGELGKCLAAVVSNVSSLGSSSTSLSVTQGVNATLMVSVLISILKLGGRVGREGALGSAADHAQKMFKDLTGL